MGKKQNNTSLPIGDIPTKEADIKRSKAYQRVISYGKYEGIYLSKLQLRQICNYLETTSQIDGVWFVIGNNKQEKITDGEKKNRKTVELLPYKLGRVENNLWPHIINNGFFDVDSNVIKNIIDNDSSAQFLDDNDNIAKRREDDPTDNDTLPPIDVIMPGGGGTSQRTPPPPAE